MTKHPFPAFMPSSPFTPREQRALLVLGQRDITVNLGQAADIAESQRSATDLEETIGRIVELGQAAEPDLAAGLYAVGLRLALAAPGPPHQRTALLGTLLASSYRALGELGLALQIQEGSFQVAKQTLAPAAAEMLTVRSVFAGILLETGDAARAESLLEEPFQQQDVSADTDPWMAASICNDLGALLLGNDLPRARKLLERALTLASAGKSLAAADQPPAHEQQLIIASTHAHLALVLMRMGEQNAAQRVAALAPGLEQSTQPMAIKMRGILALTQGRAALFAAYRDSCARLGSSHPFSLELGANIVLNGNDLEGARVALEVLAAASEALRAGSDLLGTCAYCLGATTLLSDEADWASDVVPKLLTSLPGLSEALCDAIEQRGAESLRRPAIVPLEGTDGATGPRQAFAVFHYIWACLCADYAPAVLPRALAPMHGLDSWFVLLRALDDPDAHDDAPKRARFLAARKCLQTLRARIAFLDAALTSPGMAGPASALGQQRREGHLDDRAQAEKEEREALSEYTVARQRLGELGGRYAALLRPALSLEDLSRSLGPHDVLAVTLGYPVGGFFDHELQTSQSQVILVGPDARCMVLPISSLEDLGEAALDYTSGLRQRQARRGLRDHVDAAASSKPASTTLQALRSTVQATLWRPLLTLLSLELGGEPLDELGNASPLLAAAFEHSRLHIVTGPGHHGLPLDIGNPGIPVHYYCGLPAYFQQNARACRPACGATVDVFTDPALETDFPIPFVDVEAQLVTELQAPGQVRQRPLRELLDAPVSPRVLLSCHGSTVGGAGLQHGVLQLDGARQTFLGAEQVALLRGSPGEVWISSCLGGIVGSRASGDPLGLVSELQVRGVSTVIACLAPVQDFYMPLLVALYWHGRAQHPQMPPARVLLNAKKTLRQREWPAEVLGTLTEVYRRSMEALLVQAIHHPLQDGRRVEERARAHRLYESVACWPLPGVLWNDCFGTGRAWSPALSEARHEAFSRKWCEQAHSRSQLIDSCLACLFGMDADADVQADIDAAMEHICAMTVCFGGAHGDLPPEHPG